MYAAYLQQLYIIKKVYKLRPNLTSFTSSRLLYSDFIYEVHVT